MKRFFQLMAAALLASLLMGCGYNDFQRLDESTKSSWSEVVNQYQRRADLIDNLVATVKGEANFDPQAFQKYQAAQGELGSALSRLMVTVERYPDLKANKAFADLRVALEGTENRIAVARGRYIDAVKAYNVLAREFPTNLTAKVFGYAPKENFGVADEAGISKPPRVDFGTGTAK